MAIGNLKIENYVPVVKLNEGIFTKKSVSLSGTSANLSVGGTLAVTGTSTFTGAATFTAAPVFSGGLTRPVSQSALVGATVVLTAADSGSVLINRSTSGSPSWTLPTNVAGLYFTFVVANVTAGFTVTGGTIKAKTSATGTAISGTTLTNTQGTAVVGDTITLVADGTNWVMTAQSGIFAAS
jgi:fibronectin-binding autotransporter adhesin